MKPKSDNHTPSPLPPDTGSAGTPLTDKPTRFTIAEQDDGKTVIREMVSPPGYWGDWEPIEEFATWAFQQRAELKATRHQLEQARREQLKTEEYLASRHLISWKWSFRRR